MPKARIAMHDIHEILRLRHECGRSQREIARSRGLSVGAVCKVLRRAREAGLTWPLPEGLEGKALEERLYGGPRGPAPGRRREGLDFAAASKDLSRRKHLTLRQLWLEYCERSPGGYSYSRYCELYRQWKAGARHGHACRSTGPGEKALPGLRRPDRAGAGPRGVRGAGVRRRAGSQLVFLRRGEPGARTSSPGSAPTCGPSSTSAARRPCWFPTT